MDPDLDLVFHLNADPDRDPASKILDPDPKLLTFGVFLTVSVFVWSNSYYEIDENFLSSNN